MTDYPDFIDVLPIRRRTATVTVPGSKSISIRALLLAALSDGQTVLSGFLEADDTRIMRSALQSLGVKLESVPDGVVVTGRPLLAVEAVHLFVGNSGLSLRTLLPILAFSEGRCEITGIARMLERPIGDLVTALRSQGALIEYQGAEGFLPLAVTGTKFAGRLSISVRGDASSQYLSGLLQSAVLLNHEADARVRVTGELISKPYVALTLDVMSSFGVNVSGSPFDADPEFVVPRGAQYRSPGSFRIEPDASSASYFMALGAIAGGPITLQGMRRISAQGDIRFADFLEGIGANVDWLDDRLIVSSVGFSAGFRFRSFQRDFNDMPDAAMTAAVCALFADGPSRLSNIGSWRAKETDRLNGMACELAKCGAVVETGPDWLKVTPPQKFLSAAVDTYNDHRMAMCFALVAASGAAVRLRDPGCVSKTFPTFFELLAAVVGATTTP